MLLAYFVKFSLELLIKRPPTQQGRAEWLHRFAASALRGLGVRIDVVGNFPEHGSVISNHLSYLDIVTYAALHPCAFVSKIEIASYPVVGWMATMAGTVFVARGHGGSALKARSGVEAAFEAGLPVVFFPEGTTTDGTKMLKFHGGLLSQVRNAGSEVTAAHIYYHLDADNGGATVEKEVCWGDDISLLPHILRILGLKGIRAEVHFADAPIVFASDLNNRKQAAEEAWVAVAGLGRSDKGTELVHHF